MTRKMVAAIERAGRLMQPPGLRSFGRMMKGLRRAQMRLLDGLAEAPKPARDPRLPDGARFLTRSHRTAAGQRAYRLYLPASQPVRPKGLILMLHGCNQTAEDFARGTRMNAEAEKHGLAVVYPVQTSAHNAAQCWNWFAPGDQARGGGEPAELASLMRKLTKDFGLKRHRVFVAGLSAGGAMAAILADVYPDVFAAAGVHSGLARGAASDMWSALAAMRGDGGAGEPPRAAGTPEHPVRRIVFQGDADETVHVSNADRIVTLALGEAPPPARVTKRSVRGRSYVRSDYLAPDGTVQLQLWLVKGGGHAWSGGSPAGSFTDPKGPDATALMVRFFLAE